MDMFVVNKNSKGTEIEKMEIDLFEILLYLNGTRGIFRVRWVLSGKIACYYK